MIKHQRKAQDAQAEKDLEFVRNKLGQGKEPRSREPLSERLDRLKESPRRSSPVPFNLERDVSSGNVRSERPPHPSYVPEGWGESSKKAPTPSTNPLVDGVDGKVSHSEG